MGVNLDSTIGGYMKNIEFCRNKIAEIQNDINALELNNIVIKRRGGITAQNLDGEIMFQQKRIDLLKWAETATEEEIQTKINELNNQLPTELRNYNSLISNHLPLDIYEIYCLRELLYKVVN